MIIIRKCSVCNTTEGKIYTSNNKYGVELCNKHYGQMQYCGKFLERSMFEPNEFIINGDTMEIVLYNRKHVEVGRTITDAKYYNVVKEWKWILSARGYARGQKCNAQIFLHRLITNTPDGMVVDHVNHDTLDNRESVTLEYVQYKKIHETMWLIPIILQVILVYVAIKTKINGKQGYKLAINTFTLEHL